MNRRGAVGAVGLANPRWQKMFRPAQRYVLKGYKAGQSMGERSSTRSVERRVVLEMQIIRRQLTVAGALHDDCKPSVWAPDTGAPVFDRYRGLEIQCVGLQYVDFQCAGIQSSVWALNRYLRNSVFALRVGPIRRRLSQVSRLFFRTCPARNSEHECTANDGRAREPSAQRDRARCELRSEPLAAVQRAPEPRFGQA